MGWGWGGGGLGVFIYRDNIWSNVSGKKKKEVLKRSGESSFAWTIQGGMC